MSSRGDFVVVLLTAWFGGRQGQTLEELTDECTRTKAAVEKAKADFKEMRKLLKVFKYPT